MLNALFGVAYELKTPFFPQLVAPNVAPKPTHIELVPYTSRFNSKSRVRLGRRNFEPPTS
jgi:hypothetical protein